MAEIINPNGLNTKEQAIAADMTCDGAVDGFDAIYADLYKNEMI
jgi:hypothetical protein